MADTKISALTTATTPLAGTEVLPIVQSSTTKKVATDDLTVKNIRSNATTGILQIAGPGTGTTRTMTTPNANFTVARTDASQTFTGAQTFSNISINGNTISSTNSNGDINITPNGTGNTVVNSNRLSFPYNGINSIQVTLTGTAKTEMTAFSFGKGSLLVVATYNGNDGPTAMWTVSSNSYGGADQMNIAKISSATGYGTGTALTLTFHTGTNYFYLEKSTTDYDGSYNMMFIGY